MFRMLFGYPIDAVTKNNWFHECFCLFMEAIHQNLSHGTEVTDWFGVIPVAYHERLESRLKHKTGLGYKLNEYQQALKKLSQIEQDLVLQTFKDQNKIDLLLSCQCNCNSINDLPQNIQNIISKSLKDLFEYAFNLLTVLEIRDQHYQVIYKSIPSRVCPFCGYEKFGAVLSKREALDHYLLKDLYPFAAINLRNLVPMGHKCNSQYKHIANILYKDVSNRTRRKAFDPYNHNVTISLCLNNSEPFAGTAGIFSEPLPKWEVEFIPMSDEIETWDDVFNIKDRYVKDYLDAEFKSWLDIFTKWYQRNKQPQNSNQHLVNALQDYATDLEYERFGEEAFLKAAVFRMLHIHCSQGAHQQRLIDFIRGLFS
jgi:hypothetical protein